MSNGISLVLIRNNGQKIVQEYPTPSRAETEALGIMTRDSRGLREIKIMNRRKVLVRWRAYTAWKRSNGSNSDKPSSGF